MAIKKPIGARYYPGWWADPEDPRGPPWSTNRWFWIGAHPDRKPLQGTYNEADGSSVITSMKEAEEGGIDYFSVCYFYSSVGKKPRSDNAIKHMAAAAGTNTKFHVAFDSNTPSDIPIASLDDLRDLIGHWKYLADSQNYLHIDGRPVLEMIKLDDIDKVVRPATGLTHKEMLDFIREHTQLNWYIIASGHALPHWMNVAKVAGYDAYSAYNIFTTWSNRDTTPVAGPAPTNFKQLSENYGNEWAYLLGVVGGCTPPKGGLSFDYVLPVTTGFDDRPWFPQKSTVGVGTKAELQAHFSSAMEYLEKHPQVRMACIYAWNEWAEGGYLEPSYKDGRMKLGVLKNCRSAIV